MSKLAYTAFVTHCPRRDGEKLVYPLLCENRHKGSGQAQGKTTEPEIVDPDVGTGRLDGGRRCEIGGRNDALRQTVHRRALKRNHLRHETRRHLTVVEFKTLRSLDDEGGYNAGKESGLRWTLYRVLKEGMGPYKYEKDI